MLELRRGKGMVWDLADPTSRSAGSLFTNPVVPAQRAVEGCPSWPAGDGLVKLSAAWLVQHAGFGRGTREGRGGTSSRHSLALTTDGERLYSQARLPWREISDALTDLHPELGGRRAGPA